jgi:hypothetical protein
MTHLDVIKQQSTRRFMAGLLCERTTSPVYNYVLAGLTSSLMQEGSVRLFTAERETFDYIAPHSHRFPLACFVVQGQVQNTLWWKTKIPGHSVYRAKRLTYHGAPGEYGVEMGDIDGYKHECHTFNAGDVYTMKADEIHSIRFNKGAVVLFIEGEEETNETVMLEPHINDTTIHLGAVKDYMFERR